MQQSTRSAGLARPPHQTHARAGRARTQASVRLPYGKERKEYRPCLSLLRVTHLLTPLLCPLPVALPPRHSLQTLGVSRGQRRTLLPHTSPSLLLWDGPEQRPNVGAPGAAEHPQTLEPELPPPSASTPAVSRSLPERGAKINYFQGGSSSFSYSFALN